jgi:hypothetical protein
MENPIMSFLRLAKAYETGWEYREKKYYVSIEGKSAFTSEENCMYKYYNLLCSIQH